MLDHPLGVDQEQAAQGDVGIGKDAIVGRHGLGKVCQQRVLQALDATQVARPLGPGEVTELAVDTYTQDRAVEFLELFVAIGECQDLGGQTNVKSRG